jgi:omega-amidase
MNAANLRVSALQLSIHWENKLANFQKIENLWQDLPADRHLIVLPEMFSTGFSMNPSGFAESMNGDSVKWMKKMSIQSGAYVAGSLIICEDNSFYNRFICATPGGDVLKYDKRHLFSMAGEEKHYKAGEERVIWDVFGWRILPQICYDLRFPVWSRNNLDYDAIIYPANWPERRSAAWKSLLVARAIENQAYVIGVNRIGEDGNGINHSGDSAMYDPLGELQAQLQSHQEGWLHAEWQKDNLAHIRKAFPFLQDADEFRLK